MKRLVRIIFSFAGALLALLAAGNFNLFALMKFIPRSSSYDVCITVYFTVFDAIMNWLFDYICGRIDRRKTVVKVELESKERDRNGVPQILLTQEMAEFKVRVHISGKRKNIQGSEIRFKALKQASYTVGKRGAGIHQDGNGDIFIRIDELINGIHKLLFCGPYIHELISFRDDLQGTLYHVLREMSLRNTSNYHEIP